MTTCLKSANAALSCTNTTSHRQHPANAAMTPATAMGQGPSDNGDATTMGESPLIVGRGGDGQRQRNDATCQQWADNNDIDRKTPTAITTMGNRDDNSDGSGGPCCN
ncbi:hypothetical protein EDB89DRAFT_1903235 [Lactarius sanguifluus]|nr:hypothetical protein EDB89DRAFT_1903235 [Lactarius sanguifluus]